MDKELGNLEDDPPGHLQQAGQTRSASAMVPPGTPSGEGIRPEGVHLPDDGAPGSTEV